MPDASTALDVASRVVDSATRNLARLVDVDGKVSVAKLDEHQVFAYDLAHAASAVAGCRSMLAYGEHGEFEAALARFYVADAIWDLATRILGRELSLIHI